jgi:hypothetical protein
MLDRRQVLKGGAAILCCGTTRTSASAYDYLPYHGCAVDAPELSRRLPSAPASMNYQTSSDRPVLHGSGDPNFDRALAQSLFMLANMFSVKPGFAFSYHVYKNAFASPSKALGRDDGSVVFGNSLFDDIRARGGEHWDVGIVTICAHEFGHIAQRKHGYFGNLITCENDSSGTPICRVKRLELHADFCAGYFAGRRKLENSNFPAALAAKEQFLGGDNDYGSPDHHGSPEERGQAVVAGFNASYRDRQSFETALVTGANYVSQISLGRNSI